MGDFFSKLFDTDFMPHGHCYFWKPEILWLHVGSDLAIAAAYYSIPLALIYFVRQRRDLAFPWIFTLFGAFILACGTTHILDVVTVWTPAYRIEGVIKLVTAGLSVATAALLWPLIPRALGLPSPEDLREANRNLEHRVEARTAELQTSNRDLGAFAYVASHDLKEPLRMVSAYLGLLGKHYSETLDARGQRYLEHAQNGSRRMQTMIDDLLAYASLSQNELPTEDVDLGELIGDVVSELGPALTEAGAEVEYAALPRTRANRTALHLIAENLLSNAVHYRDPARPLRIHVEATTTAGRLVLSFRDNAVGIPEAHHKRVFELFERLDTTREGTGIGLATVARLAERMGGGVRLESTEGVGSTFHVELPG